MGERFFQKSRRILCPWIHFSGSKEAYNPAHTLALVKQVFCLED
jgi:hypothetical protein